MAGTGQAGTAATAAPLPLPSGAAGEKLHPAPPRPPPLVPPPRGRSSPPSGGPAPLPALRCRGGRGSGGSQRRGPAAAASGGGLKGLRGRPPLLPQDGGRRVRPGAADGAPTWAPRRPHVRDVSVRQGARLRTTWPTATPCRRERQTYNTYAVVGVVHLWSQGMGGYCPSWTRRCSRWWACRAVGPGSRGGPPNCLSEASKLAVFLVMGRLPLQRYRDDK